MKYENQHIQLFNVGQNVRAIPFSGFTALPPHVKTLRESYTVNRSKRALIHLIDLNNFSLVQASSPDLIQQSLELTKLGEAPVQLVNNQGFLQISNQNKTLNLMAGIPLFPGDKLELFTQDESTGGVIIFTASLVILEYDF